MSFENLKKQSKLGSLTEKLAKQVESLKSTSKADDRFWKPQMDKTDNGFAVIRFLPVIEGEDLPWVRLYTHAFQGKGGWYIENSLTTMDGKQDPVSVYNRSLVNQHGGDFKRCPKDIQETVRKQKRKLNYFSNIYVVKDPLNPQNEGKVFLFKYGSVIFDKIADAMKPKFEDESPIDPFDLWRGANFKIKILKKDGYWNYDKSEFESPSPLFDDDAILEEIYNKQYSLQALVAPDQFKSYEELENRMNMVLGLTPSRSPVEAREVMEQEDELEQLIQRSSSSSSSSENESEYALDDEDDDTLKYFERLANSD